MLDDPNEESRCNTGIPFWFLDDKFDNIVYTKHMVVKKKEVAVSAPLEESVVKEERPAVTQVVEVVTEDVVPVDQEADEKRKVLVDELFQNHAPESPRLTPEISMHSNHKTHPLLLWAIGTVVVCLVVGGALLFMSGKSGSLPVVATTTPTPTPEATPTPTSGEVLRGSLSIQVLNGGGVAGAASKMKKILEDKGYSVVETGNAESYTYDNTEIIVKSSKKAYLSVLEEDLKDIYSLGSSAATLEDSASYDARVIVGKK